MLTRKLKNSILPTVIKPETVQVTNKCGTFTFCALQREGEDGGFRLLSLRLLDLFGPSNNHYLTVTNDLIKYIRGQLELTDYYVLRIEENYTFFNADRQDFVFENAPIIAQQIADKDIKFGFNREFKIHQQIISFRK
jgi:hypothetical protein